MILYVQFLAVNVAISHSHDAGIALHLKLQFILCHRYTTPHLVYSMNAYVHQVGTISQPLVVFWYGYQSNGFVGGLNLVSGHNLIFVIGYSL